MAPRNLVLIDSRLPDISGITNSLTTFTDYLVFNYHNKTLTTLYADISNLATSKTATYTNIALAQDYQYEYSLKVVNVSDTEALITDVAPYNTFSGLKIFLTNLHTNIGTNTFNFLACNLYNLSGAPAILSSLQSQTGVTLRASNDFTGSTALNIGNYVMESHNTDITSTFFDLSINKYTHLFLMDWFNNNQYNDLSKNVVGTEFAFATIDTSGRVWAWGAINNGGAGPDSKTAGTPINLSGVIVKELYSTRAAFAAKDTSGNMWIWGNSSYGGSLTANTAQKLSISAPVTQIRGNYQVFIALDTSGKVWNWSNGNLTTSSNNTNGMSGEIITKIYTCANGCVALSTTGKVWAWGNIDGNSPLTNVTSAYVPTNLPSTIIDVTPGAYAFAALESNNNAWAWGSTLYGGLAGGPTTATLAATNISKLYASAYSFAAISTNSDVSTNTVWGDSAQGGALTLAQSPLTLPLTNVQEIASSSAAFATIDLSGMIACWGSPFTGGGIQTNRASIPSNLPSSGIQKIYGYNNTFAVLDASSYVRTWGSPLTGGTNGLIPIDISTNPISQIYGNTNSFAVIDTSGRAWAWGDTANGGVGSAANRAAIPGGLPSGIVAIYSTRYAYAAIDSSGHIWTWGNTSYGGTGINSTTSAIPVNLENIIIPTPTPPTPPEPPTPTPEPPQTIVDILNSISQKNRPASEEDNRIVGRILSGERNFTSYSDYNYRMIAANIGASCNC